MKKQRGGILVELAGLLIVLFIVANVPELRSVMNTALDKIAIFSKNVVNCAQSK